MAKVKSVLDKAVTETIAHPPSTKVHPSPEAWEDQVLYFLLPDRFSDGKEEGYGGKTPKYDAKKDKNSILSKQDEKERDRDAAVWREHGVDFFNGGTLNGLKGKLPYLKKLGVTALWVGPLFRQLKGTMVDNERKGTYHGYAVQDFLDVDPSFGTREDLRDLVKAAHDLGIYVLLDIILNHSGDVFKYKAQSPNWSGDTFDVEGFYDTDHKGTLGSSMTAIKDDTKCPDAAIWPAELQSKDCFTRKGKIQRWDDFPEYLEGDFFDLKDLDLGNADPDNFKAGAALPVLCEVYKYWIAYADLDGYRIDTVKHMGDGPTRYFASVIHEYAQSIGKERFLLIGEITGTRAFDTVEATGIDAALGVGNVQQTLWQVPRGDADPTAYFSLFRNALYLNKGSHTWFRDKVVTMIDDHDQVWKGGAKQRFCWDALGQKLVKAATGLNLLTLGIPCIYYGTEQAFDGEGGGSDPDRYIREAMFGGRFGPFRSTDRHCFDESNEVYKAVGEICQLRDKEMALRRGRQFLREVSGDGVHFGYPAKGSEPIKSIIAWSRLFAGEEVLCAINTNAYEETSQWVTLDRAVHPPQSKLTLLYPKTSSGATDTLTVADINGRSTVQIRVPGGGMVVFK